MNISRGSRRQKWAKQEKVMFFWEGRWYSIYPEMSLKEAQWIMREVHLMIERREFGEFIPRQVFLEASGSCDEGHIG